MYVIDSGNTAAAIGVKLSRAQVIAAYPITPQTPLTEKLSEFVESGDMDAQYIPVESEHSSLAWVGAEYLGSFPSLSVHETDECCRSMRGQILLTHIREVSHEDTIA